MAWKGSGVRFPSAPLLLTRSETVTSAVHLRHDAAVTWSWALVLVVIATFALAPAAGVSTTLVSKKRNLRRAKASGALWVGLANVDAEDAGSLRPWPMR